MTIEAQTPDILRLPAGSTGAGIGPFRQVPDARWLMAYAAVLGETSPDYLDTTRADGIIAHPLFPVCYEWPAWIDLHRGLFRAEILARGVHATHDLYVHRALKVDQPLFVSASITGVAPHRAGARVNTRFDSVDANGVPVSTTHVGSIYRGVFCAEERRTDHAAPTNESAQASAWPAHMPVTWSTRAPVTAGFAHVYSECSRIWNPIHTDRAIALAAGLPGIVLHGTALLALAIGAVLRHSRHGASQVTRLHGRFRDIVRLPAMLVVEGTDAVSHTQWFRVTDDSGRVVLDNGLVSTAGMRRTTAVSSGVA